MKLIKNKNKFNSIENEYSKIIFYPNSTNDKYQKRSLFKYFKENKNKLNDYRIKIDTGFACNAKCYFCYYKSHLNDPFLKLSEIKKQINIAKIMNFKQVEFSGGESTYHPEWFNMLKIAQKLDLKSSLVSNGLLLSDFDFIKKSNDFGLNEILFSVHGYEENHDKMIGVLGAYNKILKAIEYANKLNIITRINITVNKLNLNTIEKNIKNLLKNFDIRQINFIEINNSHESFNIATKQHLYNYENFKNLFKIFDYIIKNIKYEDCLNIRYVPYCVINEKYHKYIKNYIHHWFDKWDWNPFFVHRTDFTTKKIKDWNNRNINKFIDQLLCTRNFWYYKNENCYSCQFKELCDGYKK